MGKRFLNIVGIILAFFCIWVFLKGLKVVFSTEKVYKEIGQNIYHSTPYCEAIDGISSFDEEYMRDTGHTPGTEKMSRRDAYYNQELDMCTFCFSPLERKSRAEYLEKIIELRENKK